ncbi:MAG TPA: ZIP family metal transporter [Savagea sp.]
MKEALLWGGVAGFANVLGALIVLKWSISERWIGYFMAVGTGALIGAVTFELLEEALQLGSLIDVAWGFLGGALLFTLINSYLHRKGAGRRKRSNQEDGSAAASGRAILVGTVMDAIPETMMIGFSLLHGQVSQSLVFSVFLSNVPEGISSTSGLRKGGMSRGKVLGLWSIVFVLSMGSAWVGYTLLSSASVHVQALLNAFAAGGILAMLASTMMPEAYEKDGAVVGFLTALGLFLTLLLQ